VAVAVVTWLLSGTTGAYKQLGAFLTLWGIRFRAASVWFDSGVLHGLGLVTAPLPAPRVRASSLHGPQPRTATRIGAAGNLGRFSVSEVCAIDLTLQQTSLE